MVLGTPHLGLSCVFGLLFELGCVQACWLKPLRDAYVDAFSLRGYCFVGSGRSEVVDWQACWLCEPVTSLAGGKDEHWQHNAVIECQSV